MTTQAQTQQDQVLVLKAKLFDQIEILQQQEKSISELAGALGEIAKIAAVEPNESGNVTIDEVVAAVATRFATGAVEAPEPVPYEPIPVVTRPSVNHGQTGAVEVPTPPEQPFSF